MMIDRHTDPATVALVDRLRTVVAAYGDMLDRPDDPALAGIHRDLVQWRDVRDLLDRLDDENYPMGATVRVDGVARGHVVSPTLGGRPVPAGHVTVMVDEDRHRHVVAMTRLERVG